jgi:Uri superfamily endonuclease
VAGVKGPGVVTGTYTILVNLPEAATVAVGALGEHRFPAGYYAYTGSAFGPGGFARVDRHMEIAAGDRDARHWHVDYLLGDTPARIETVVRSAEVDIECEVAASIDDVGETVVPGFGASDCDCQTHLHFTAEKAPLLAAIRSAHD